MQTPDKVQGKLSDRWATLCAKKQPLLTRAEQYAKWTLPYVFPELGQKNTEEHSEVDSTGAQAVNNLANKVTQAMFGPNFFKLEVSDKMMDRIAQVAAQGDQDAQNIMKELDNACIRAERTVQADLLNSGFVSEATTASKQLIVTGNSLMYLPEKGKAQTYSLRDYCVCRDLAGTVIEIMTRDCKAFVSLPQEVRDKLKADRTRTYTDESEVHLYTQLKLKSDGKYHTRQMAGDVDLDSDAVWPADELPYIVLTWNRMRGDDYGRGLVEDYAGTFHALHVLSGAITDIVAIAADIKFLVRPASMVDVMRINNSPSGSYHTGEEGDITVVQINKLNDFQLAENRIQQLVQQISRAFLLNSSIQRDAERVTAEEIRYMAQELDTSNGGIYSRQAVEWQLPVVRLRMLALGVTLGNFKDGGIIPQIVTGLESLSRASEMDSLRLWMQDLSMLNQVPPQFQNVIDPMKFSDYCGGRRGVDTKKILKSPEQLQAEYQQQMQQQQQLQNMQTDSAIAQTAAANATAT